MSKIRRILHEIKSSPFSGWEIPFRRQTRDAIIIEPSLSSSIIIFDEFYPISLRDRVTNIKNTIRKYIEDFYSNRIPSRGDSPLRTPVTGALSVRVKRD